jgi:hypothetical protein
MIAWYSRPYKPNNFAIAADTSSRAAAGKPEVGPAALALAALIAEPILSTSAAVDANISGAVIRYDISPISPSLPLNGTAPGPRLERSRHQIWHLADVSLGISRPADP